MRTAAPAVARTRRYHHCKYTINTHFIHTKWHTFGVHNSYSSASHDYLVKIKRFGEPIQEKPISQQLYRCSGLIFICVNFHYLFSSIAFQLFNRFDFDQLNVSRYIWCAIIMMMNGSSFGGQFRKLCMLGTAAHGVRGKRSGNLS